MIWSSSHLLTFLFLIENSFHLGDSVGYWCSQSVGSGDYSCYSRSSSYDKCFSYGDDYYYVVGRCMDYYDAVRYCESKNMEISTVTGNSQDNWVAEKSCYGANEITWIGIRKYSGRNYWINGNGYSLCCSNWRSGQPKSNHDCAVYGVNYDKGWTSISCWSKAKVICQTKMPYCRNYYLTLRLYNSRTNSQLQYNGLYLPGESVYCRLTGNFRYFNHITVTQTCGGSAVASQYCYSQYYCYLKLRTGHTKSCTVSCSYSVKQTYQKYVRNGGLSISRHSVAIRVSNVDLQMHHYDKQLTDDSSKDIITAGEQILCKHETDQSKFIQNLILTQTCNDQINQILCNPNQKCSLRIRCPQRDNCTVSCYYTARQEYRPYLNNGATLGVTFPVNVSCVKDNYCLSYENVTYSFYEKEMNYVQAERLCSAVGKYLGKILDGNHLEWLTASARRLNRNKEWYISKSQEHVNCQGKCCLISGKFRVGTWSNKTCSMRANVICEDNTLQCDHYPSWLSKQHW